MPKQNPTLGHLKAELAEPGLQITDDLLERLNRNCQPPEPLSADDVYVRAMFIVSDEVNSYGGRFPRDEHDHLSQLLIDSPVLVGHRQDKLPVGRNFHATSVERDGRHWVKSYFYWLRSADGAENLLKNIDGGVYKECSIGFSFRFPECSICGKDIRLCEHEPFAKYAAPGGEQVCHFNYRQIEKVLETSLVYRGAIKNTSISNELSQCQSDSYGGLNISQIDTLSDLEESERYLVLPRYETISGTLTICDRQLTVYDDDGERLIRDIIDHRKVAEINGLKDIPVRLVGMRGKERCRPSQLLDFLLGFESPVSRLLLLTMPSDSINLPAPIRVNDRIEIKSYPFRLGPKDQLERLSQAVATRDGVEIWSLNAEGNPVVGKFYLPPSLSDHKRFDYALTLNRTNGQTQLELSHPDLPGQVVVCHCDQTVPATGQGYLADILGDRPHLNSTLKPVGKIQTIRKNGAGWSLRLSGQLSGEYCLRPVKQNGRERWLFCPAEPSANRAGTKCE